MLSNFNNPQGFQGKEFIVILSAYKASIFQCEIEKGGSMHAGKKT
jgi:hypothetical protein